MASPHTRKLLLGDHVSPAQTDHKSAFVQIDSTLIPRVQHGLPTPVVSVGPARSFRTTSGQTQHWSAVRKCARPLAAVGARPVSELGDWAGLVVRAKELNSVHSRGCNSRVSPHSWCFGGTEICLMVLRFVGEILEIRECLFGRFLAGEGRGPMRRGAYGCWKGRDGDGSVGLGWWRGVDVECVCSDHKKILEAN